VHTVLVLSSTALVLLGGLVALWLANRLGDWEQRRALQLLVLSAPVASLGLALLGLHHFTGQICFIAAPTWDQGLGLVLPLGMAASALAALAVGLARLATLRHVFRRGGLSGGPELEAVVAELADRLGAPRPRLVLAASERPLALAIGVVRPTLLLSPWMLAHLDKRELASVVAHELAHVVRRDSLVAWMATVLRDAFWYLPTSWLGQRQLRRDTELAADDLAVSITGGPLALASALAQVWEAGLSGRPSVAQALAGSSDLMEGRIRRLLAGPVPRSACSRPSAASLWTGAVALAGVTAAEGANLALLAAPMGCGPLSALSRLL
jgi:Zn-dependent protease with chaperone function